MDLENLILPMEMSALQQTNLTLQEGSSLLEDTVMNLSKQVTALEQCSSLLLDIRHRFLSMYKQEHKILPLTSFGEAWISPGNLEAHGSNVKLDATLSRRP
jgi:hypothetical protein